DVTPNNGTVYYYHVTSVDRVGNESIPSDTVSALPAVYNGYYEETATGLDYTGSWSRQYSGNASGSYYNRSAEADATLTVSFYGTGIRWIGAYDRSGGIAEVTFDGEAEQVDLYNASSQYQVTVYEKTGLSNGIHNLTIRVTGNRNAASSGAYVYIDAIEVTGDVLKTGRVEENSVVMDYSGIWNTRSDNAHSGGRMMETGRAGAALTYVFYGTGIEWLAEVGNSKGIAEVSIDGEAPVLVDLYRPSASRQQVVYRRYGLELGKHTIRIEVTGRKNASSGNVYVNIDAFNVVDPVTEKPSVPANISSASGEGSITISWGSAGPEVVGYEVYRYRGILEDGLINRGLVRGESYTDYGLVPGKEYTYRVAAVGALGDKSDLSLPATAAAGALVHDTTLTGTPGFYEENDSAITYMGTWDRPWSDSASGNYYRRSSQEGAGAVFTFVGTAVKWIGHTSSSGGIAEVWIDGRQEAIVNLNKNVTEYQQVLYQRTHLARGQHTLEIKVFTGQINIDGFIVLDNMEDLSAPEVPQGLTAQKGNTTAEITWTAGSEEDIIGYRLYRSDREDGGFVPVGNKMLNILPQPSYNDTGLVNGKVYYYTVTAIDEAGNESVTAPVVSVIPCAPAGFYEENDLGIVYSGAWSRLWDSNCSGSNYMRSNTEGDTVSFVFEGTGIRWIGRPDTNGGIAEVYVDGVLADTVDLYRPQTEYGVIVWQSRVLSLELHQITIKNISNKHVNIDAFEVVVSSDTIAPAAPSGLTVLREGNKNHIQWYWGTEEDLYGYYVYRSETGQPGSFSRINTDAIRYGTTFTDVIDESPVYYCVTAIDESGNESEYSMVISDILAEESNAMIQEDNKAINYSGVWNRTASSSASEGYHMTSTDEGLKVRYVWYGTGMDWIAAKTPSSGIAKVVMDDGQPVLVDLYSGTAQYQQAVYRVRNLPLGLHTLEITYHGRNIKSSSSSINVDAFKVVDADIAVPVPPGNVKANSLVNKVQLTWDKLDTAQYPDIIGYNVYYRYEVYDWQKANLAGLVQSGFVHTGLNLSTRYYYVVTAVDALGNESAVSQEVYAETAEHMIMAVLEPSYEVVRGEPFTFSARNSYTADPPLTYEWDLDGDGEYDDAYGVEVSHTFNTAGQYTIGLRVKDSKDRISTATATVNVKVAVTGVYLDKDSLTLELGASDILTATVVPEDAENKKVIWKSNNTNIVIVDQNGRVTGISPGTATVTVTTEEGNYSDTCIVTVFQPNVPVTGVTLDKDAVTLFEGEVQKLVATVLPYNASNKNVTWNSANEDVAVVDQNGNITAIAAGIAVITVTTEDGGYTAECTVTVVSDTEPPYITNIIPSNGATMGGAQSKQLFVYFTDNKGYSRTRAEFEYSLNGVEWLPIEGIIHGPYGSAPHYFYIDWELEPLVSGEYFVRYTVYDEAGNKGQQTVVYKIDRTPPAAPQSLNGTAEGGSIRLSWQAPFDSDIAYYQVYRAVNQGSFLQYVKVTGRENVSYVDTNVQAGVEYQYKVTAVDKFNQEGDFSNTISVTAVTDTTAPVILGIDPPKGTVLGPSAKITVRAEDNVKVASITLQYSTDGNVWQDIGTVENKSIAIFQWNTAPLGGNVYVRAIALDPAGNTSDGTPVRTYEIDNQGPSKITGLNATPRTTSVLLRWNDVPDLDFSYFQVEKRDSEGNFQSIGTVSTELGYNVTGLEPETTYIFRVVAYDRVGNRGIASDEVIVTTLPDTEVPVVTNISPAPGYYANEIRLRGTASDNVGISTFTFQYSRDLNTWLDLATIVFTSPSRIATATYSWDVSSLEEGSYYVRGKATDTAGNESATYSGSNYVEYIVDHTGPTVTGANAVAKDGYVELTWDANPPEDAVKSYNVYKWLDAENTKTITVNTLGYRDFEIEPETEYRYRVSAVDMAGNEGPATDWIIVSTMPDTIAPTILSVSPITGSSLPANPRIYVLAKDDYGVKSITAEYQLDGGQEDVWHLIGTQAPDPQVAIFNWDTQGLGDGTYKVRLTAVDKSGNRSDSTIVSYTLNLQPPAKPELTAVAGGWRVDLSWTSQDEEDLAGFRIYRSTTSGSGYKKIGETPYTSYTDAPLAPDKIYYYKVEALDIYNNGVWSEEVAVQPTTDDPYLPVAVAGDEQIVTVGMEVVFDGTQSSDNDRIERFVWDFGDGSTAMTAQPVHVYNSVGTYTVSLTVYDPAGNHDTDTLQVVVREPQQVGTLEVRVIDDSSGAPLPGASIVIQYPDGTMQKVIANSQGMANIVAEAGEYKVYAYKTDYKPTSVDATVLLNQSTSQIVRLKKGELVVGELTVRRLTIDEIEAAGIDVTAPENQWVYQFEVHLAFNNTPLPPVVHTVTGGGTFIGDSWKPIIIEHPGEPGKPTKVDKVYPIAVPHPGRPEVRPTIAYLVIPGEARWLKEFFEVGLVLENTADPEFVITDSLAVLKLQDGLSLAPTQERQSLEVDLGDIAGGESREVKWIIRGDKKGWYSLEADFTGILQPFGDAVYATFMTKEPFRVWGDDAIKMHIDAQDRSDKGYPYHVRFGIENISDIPVYNASFKLLEQGKQNYIYAPNQQLEVFTRELPAGETLWADYILVPCIDGDLILSYSYTLKTGGDAAIPEVITSHTVIENTPGVAPVLNETHNADGTVTLRWDSVENATGYRIYYVRDDLYMSGPEEMVYEAGPDENTVTLQEPQGQKDYIITALFGDKEVMRHAVTGLSWCGGADEPVITVNPKEIPVGCDTELWITVNYKGYPVAGGTVDIGDYASGIVLDENGQARITIRPLTAGEILVTAHHPQNLWSVSTTIYAVDVADVLYGDVNGDKEITAGDAVLILRNTVGLVQFSDKQKEVADVSGDGEISAGDAILILRYTVGLIDKFPVETK
ncbi:MAG: PKD domain-containing protein, partial [Clostridiaceae bacterium]|nr:PKD domain-containing protein [Clostridiaceae bacterium]